MMTFSRQLSEGCYHNDFLTSIQTEQEDVQELKDR